MSTAALDVTELERRLREARIVPVVRVADAETAHSLVARLLTAGLDVIELTTTVAGWRDVVIALRADHPELCVGVGTVMSAPVARQAVEAGAHFCVSPRLVPDARAELQRAGVPIVDIQGDDAIFHTVFDLNERYQVPGAQFLESGQTWEHDGVTPRWRGIYDDKGRLMVAICHNMDLGDSWENADDPHYPQKFSALGIRIGVNYLTYAMTH